MHKIKHYLQWFYYCDNKLLLSLATFLPVFCVAICLRRAAVAAACWAEMVTGMALSVGGAPCFTVFVASAVLSAPLRLILLVGTTIQYNNFKLVTM